jgi:hypothetical protein
MRRSLVDWLTDMSLISAGGLAEADGYIGYMKPYATAHEALDQDKAFQEKVLNVARALGTAVNLYRAGKRAHIRRDEIYERNSLAIVRGGFSPA